MDGGPCPTERVCVCVARCALALLLIVRGPFGPQLLREYWDGVHYGPISITGSAHCTIPGAVKAYFSIKSSESVAGI